LTGFRAKETKFLANRGALGVAFGATRLLTASSNVRVRGRSGKYTLAVISSHFVGLRKLSGRELIQHGEAGHSRTGKHVRGRYYGGSSGPCVV
jgi:hypothetical protein